MSNSSGSGNETEPRSPPHSRRRLLSSSSSEGPSIDVAMSNSSGSGNETEPRSPPHSRRRLLSSSSSEGPSIDVAAASQATRRPRVRRRRGAGSRRGLDSASLDRAIDSELLIQLVEELPPDWEQASRQYKDRMWEEITAQVITCWEELRPKEKATAVNDVKVRWRSMRDRMKRQYNAEQRGPRGSAANRRQYCFTERLRFLIPTFRTRNTIDSTREEPPSISEPPFSHPQASDNPGPSTSACRQGLEQSAPLPPVSQSVAPRGAISSSSPELLTRDRGGRKRPTAMEYFASISHETFARLDERMDRFEESLSGVENSISEIRSEVRQLEGATAVLSKSSSISSQFLQTLEPWMEQMSPSNAYKCRIAATHMFWGFLHRPPSPPPPYAPSPSNQQNYPPVQYHPPTHSEASSHPSSPPHLPLPSSLPTP
ncbi:uncharacterized protein RB166_013801 [Leptodactylus fuscus]|uniref:uncharacterized protein LOC142213412 n=1 Tax=Leptodactylus fuscus TaxID=238119 RepID=UPI003F4E5F71